METELHALEQNGTRQLTSLPVGKQPSDSKWMYLIKYNQNGTIDRFKARI